jgi:hypothetical protein
MKIIITKGEYGFGHDWALVTGEKRFLLGSGREVLHPCIGMQPSDVVARIGTREISEGEVGNKRLAKFILSELGLTKKDLKELNTWELCAS